MGISSLIYTLSDGSAVCQLQIWVPNIFLCSLGFHQPVYTNQGHWAASSVERLARKHGWDFHETWGPILPSVAGPFPLPEYTINLSPRAVA